jgi:hypothetical protein
VAEEQAALGDTWDAGRWVEQSGTIGARLASDETKFGAV